MIKKENVYGMNGRDILRLAKYAARAKQDGHDSLCEGIFKACKEANARLKNDSRT